MIDALAPTVPRMRMRSFGHNGRIVRLPLEPLHARAVDAYGAHVVNAIVTLLLKALLVLGIARLVPGIRLAGYGSAILVAAVYGVLTALLAVPIAVLFLPLTIFTFGLFMLVINGFLLWLTDKLIGSFEIEGLMPLAVATVGLTVGDVVVKALASQLL